MEFIFATNNTKKMEEIRRIAAGAGISVVSMGEVGFDLDIAEDGDTFEENAAIKAAAVVKASGKPALADDSGLEIDFLAGKPGVYSARFMGHDTPYDVKNARILELMRDVPAEKRGARFVCAIAAAFPGGLEPRVITERGVFEGRIAERSAGAGGFGYDPIFFVPEFGRTSAELTPAEKDASSHRGKALRAMFERLGRELL